MHTMITNTVKEKNPKGYIGKTPINSAEVKDQKEKTDKIIKLEQTTKLINKGKISKTKETNDSENVKTNIKCDLCQYQSVHKSNVKRHKRLIHEGKKNIESTAVNSHAEKNKIVRNFSSIMKEESIQFKCESCDFSNNNKHNMKRHVEQVHGKKKSKIYFKCDLCNYNSNDASNYKKHTEIHSREKGVKTFLCDKCKRYYSSKVNLAKHKTDAHSGLIFSCTHCSKKFSTKGNLKQHQIVHNKDSLTSTCTLTSK